MNDEHEQAGRLVKSKFSGSEAYQLDPHSTALQIAEAGAVLMGRFRNRLESLEREAKRGLPHSIRFKINDGMQLVISTEIYG